VAPVILAVCLLLTMPMHASGQDADDRPRVLLLTGQNNHDWQRTAPMIRQILQETGLFDITTWHAPGSDTPQDAIDAPDFGTYDVVVWDYNPRIRSDSVAFEDDYQWPAELRRAWVDYIRGGGKAFHIHASNNPFPGWQEFEEMVGLLWRSPAAGCALYLDEAGDKVTVAKGEGSRSGHGKKHDYVIRHRAPGHPVLQGLPERWMHAFDELYHWQRGPCPETMQVLATGWNDESIGGTGRDEPLFWQIPYGEGLVMTWLPGHLWPGQDVTSAHQCAGFQTIVQRSVEWLATGEVTQPVPDDFPGADAVSLRRLSTEPDAE
jgi:hypothetical protein